jgi:hypothetical protein
MQNQQTTEFTIASWSSSELVSLPLRKATEYNRCGIGVILLGSRRQNRCSLMVDLLRSHPAFWEKELSDHRCEQCHGGPGVALEGTILYHFELFGRSRVTDPPDGAEIGCCHESQ